MDVHYVRGGWITGQVCCCRVFLFQTPRWGSLEHIITICLPAQLEENSLMSDNQRLLGLWNYLCSGYCSLTSCCCCCCCSNSWAVELLRNYCLNLRQHRWFRSHRMSRWGGAQVASPYRADFELSHCVVAMMKYRVAFGIRLAPQISSS